MMKKYFKRLFALLIAVILGFESSVVNVFAGQQVEQNNCNQSVYEGAGYRVVFVLDDLWQGGYNASVYIENTGNVEIENWIIAFDFPFVIDNIWNAEVLSDASDELIIRNAGWNNTIPVGGTVSFGISAQENFSSFPTCFRLVGQIFEVDGDDLDISYSVMSEWNEGFNAGISIKNEAECAIEGWYLEFDYARTITDIWNAEILSHDGIHYVIRNVKYNSVIRPGQQIEIGFLGCDGDCESVLENICVKAYMSERNINNDGDLKEDVSGNSVSYDSVSSNTVSGDVIVSGNMIPKDDEDGKVGEGVSGNSASGDVVSGNVVSGNEVSGNNTYKADLTDSDDDGLPDFYEDAIGANKYNMDSDGDGLPDGYEIFSNLTNPTKADSDDNGINDNFEDSDNDNLSNAEEFDLCINPLDPDTDGDRIRDDIELEYGLNPNKQDTYDDGVIDGDRIFEVERECEISDNGLLKPSIKVEISGSQIESFNTYKLDNDDPFLNDDIAGYIGNGYEFYVENGITGALLSIEVDEAILNDESKNLALYYWNEKKQVLEEVVEQKKTENGIEVELEHFSKYIVLDKNKYNDNVFQEIVTSQSNEIDLHKNFTITMMLDCTEEVSDYEFFSMKQQSVSFVNSLEKEDMITVYPYNKMDIPVPGSYMLLTPEKAISRIDSLKKESALMSFYYSLWSCVRTSGSNNDDSAIIMIIISKKHDTYELDQFDDIIDIALKNNVKIFAIDINEVCGEELKYISEKTGGYYYAVSDVSNLESTFTKIQEIISQDRDSDEDGISDYYEKMISEGKLVLGTGAPFANYKDMDFLSPDSDGDGLIDGEEIRIIKSEDYEYFYCYMNSNPCLVDTDNDSYDDYFETYVGVSPLSKQNEIKLASSSLSSGNGVLLENTLPEWIEMIQSGHAWNFIHNAVERHIEDAYLGIEKEETISFGYRCDLIKYTTGEIWEVKPASYQRPKKMELALRQLNHYVDLYRKSDEKAQNGGKSIVDETFFEEDYKITYKNFGNGLILYYFKKYKKESEKEPSTVKEKNMDYKYAQQLKAEDEEMFWDLVGAGILTITAGGVIAVALSDDILTGGAGIVDDTPAFAFAISLIEEASKMMSGTFPPY